MPDMSADGARAMRESRFDDAARIYRKLADRSPNVPQWHMNYGLALHSAKRYGEALAAFETYIRLASPKPGPVHFLMGVDQIKLGEPCAAIAPLEKARLWEASRQVLIELADAYSGCKRYEDAAVVLQGLKETRLAARAFWQARKYEAAKPLFASVAARHEGDPRFHYEYGDTLYRADGPEPAIPQLEKAVSIVEARGSLGRALMDLKRAEEAIPHLAAAVPVDATLLLPLSRAYKATGRSEEAARTQEEYRKRVGSQN